jgi:hypothetical protein
VESRLGLTGSLQLGSFLGVCRGGEVYGSLRKFDSSAMMTLEDVILLLGGIVD